MSFQRGPNKFNWDPNKNVANVAKHGIGFIDATAVFDDPFAVEEDSPQTGHGEARYLAVGEVEGVLFAVIFTYRNDLRRIISVRRARPDERASYRRRREAS